MKIEVKSNNSLYITLNDHTYYIDDSTGEQIVDKWKSEDFSNTNLNNKKISKYFNQKVTLPFHKDWNYLMEAVAGMKDRGIKINITPDIQDMYKRVLDKIN
tara:strand:- start:1568 stop:1870 length:303 start_codon:yes stop_codon:yes gene_type:complete